MGPYLSFRTAVPTWTCFGCTVLMMSLILFWLTLPPTKIFTGNCLLINFYRMALFSKIFPLPPCVSIVLTPYCSSSVADLMISCVWSMALWKVKWMFVPVSYLCTKLINSESISPSLVIPPITIPGTFNYFKDTTSSFNSCTSYGEYTKPMLWCLAMTNTGMSTASKHFRMTVWDGVKPPTSRAETSYIRSAPECWIA